MIIPTLRVLDRNTIEVHAPDTDVEDIGDINYYVFLDRNHRIGLGPIDFTEERGTYTLDTRTSVRLHTFIEHYFLTVYVPDATYWSAECTDPHQIITDLQVALVAAQQWIENGYPTPPPVMGTPDVPGSAITRVTAEDRSGLVVGVGSIVLSPGGRWEGQWLREIDHDSLQLRSFTYYNHQYRLDSTFEDGSRRFREVHPTTGVAKTLAGSYGSDRRIQLVTQHFETIRVDPRELPDINIVDPQTPPEDNDAPERFITTLLKRLRPKRNRS